MLQTKRLALFTVAALAGCREFPAPDAVSQFTLGDTSFVSSPQFGIDSLQSLTEVLRLSADQLDVGAISAAAFGPGGTIWIYDRQGRQGESLLVLDSLGDRVATAGRQGDGPGEYRGPSRIFRLSDGTMLLRVIGTPRAVRFGPRGETIATYVLPVAVTNGWLVTPDTGGGWYLAASFEENTPTRVGRYGWIHFGPDGATRDTVFPPAHFFEEPTPLGIAPGRVRTVSRTGAVLTTLPSENRIDLIAPDGSVTAMTWRGEAPRYADQVRRDVQHVSDRMHDLLGLAHVPLPERKAAARLLVTSPESGIWAALGAEGVRIPDEELSKDTVPLPPMKWIDRERWAWFDTSGRLRFVIDMPTGATVLDRERTRLLGVTSATDGTQSLVVWHIGPGQILTPQ